MTQTFVLGSHDEVKILSKHVCDPLGFAYDECGWGSASQNKVCPHLAAALVFKMVANALQLAKRALVILLKSLAVVYGCDLQLQREAPDDAVLRAYRRVSLAAHPDRGGNLQHQQQLNVAKEAWDKLRKQKGKSGRPPTASAASSSRPTLSAPTRSRDFRVHAEAVLLTYPS